LTFQQKKIVYFIHFILFNSLSL